MREMHGIENQLSLELIIFHVCLLRTRLLLACLKEMKTTESDGGRRVVWVMNSHPSTTYPLSVVLGSNFVSVL
jgi:hypothetical protein